MDGTQSVKTDDAVKLREHAIEVAHNVIARVPDMARIEADAKMIRELHAVDDRAQFLERPPDLRALARHRLKQHRRRLLGLQHMVELRRDKLDAALRALPDMAAGVEIIKLVRRLLHAHEVVRHHRLSKRPQIFFPRAGIHRIRRMGDNRAEGVFLHQIAQPRRIVGIDVLRLAAARIARKEGKRRSIEIERRLAHRLIAFCR